MLSKIVVVANLLMLVKGAIEMPLFKVSHSSKNILNSVNRRNLKFQPVTLYNDASELYGHYAAEIMIGGLTHLLAVDTGSADLVLHGEGCHSCAVEPIRDIRTVPVGYYDTYRGGIMGYGVLPKINTIEFNIYTTNVTMGGVQAHGQHLAYVYMHDAIFFDSKHMIGNGILGLGLEDNGLSKISNFTNGTAKAFLSTISAQNGFPNSFAMCFDPSGIGGKMIIGRGECANMQFAPLVLNLTQTYTLNLLSISINHRSFSNTADMKVLVDTGTPKIYATRRLLNKLASSLCPFLVSIGANCSLGQVPNQIIVTPKEHAKLPNININFQGVTLVVPPNQYYKRFRNTSGMKEIYQYVIDYNGFEESPPIGKEDLLIGLSALLGHWVYFDNEKHRIGFCSVKHCDQQCLG